MLQTLNREWGVSIARNYHPEHGEWPLVLLHSPGLAYAFDSHNIGLDSPAAAMDMLTAHGMHELADPYTPAPPAHGWSVLLDRDGERDSELVGPHPLAPIGPLTSAGRMPPYWLNPARENSWWCQVMFVAGVDFAALAPDELPGALFTAADEHRVAGATVRVHP